MHNTRVTAKPVTSQNRCTGSPTTNTDDNHATTTLPASGNVSPFPAARHYGAPERGHSGGARRGALLGRGLEPRASESLPSVPKRSTSGGEATGPISRFRDEGWPREARVERVRRFLDDTLGAERVPWWMTCLIGLVYVAFLVAAIGAAVAMHGCGDNAKPPMPDAPTCIRACVHCPCADAGIDGAGAP